jgi:hypothetical protein
MLVLMSKYADTKLGQLIFPLPQHFPPTSIYAAWMDVFIFPSQ